MMKKQTLGIALALLGMAAGCAADTDELAEVDPDALSLEGKADSAAEHYVRGTSLLLYGDAAHELYGVLSAAGLSSYERGSLTYVLGRRVACVSNGSRSACELLSRVIDTSSSDFEVTIHGPRFRSAASELFGALAAASGVSPVSVSTVESDRFVCGKDTYDVWCGLRSPQSAQLELDFDGLTALGDGHVYEGWLITDDGPVTSGRFDAPEEGEALTFDLDSELLESARMFVLTIEPREGDDPAPADTHLLAGVIEDGAAALTVDHPAALGTDFATAAGGFILETPTTSMVADDYDQGVWFLDPSAGPGPGLDLPELPAGWAYEGWVVTADGPMSTGRFTAANMADSDGAGATAGPDGSPPFPGQDYIDPALSLVGTTVVLSVEPMPDDSPAPFAIKPLLGMVTDAGRGAFQTLGSTEGSTLPTGTALLMD